MFDKVYTYVKEYNMLSEGDFVVAGVSGGADSVCLFFMLKEIRKRIPFEIHVVHINHKIRQEAGEDAEYVRGLCNFYEIPFTLVEADVEEIAAREHISTEEAGRNVRYNAFNDAIKKYANGRNSKIAIAHNKNDCCETFLFNLFRGTGIAGLTGIRAVRDNIIRPLLCLERSEIEDFLKSNNIPYCIDRTNLEDNYTRNRIRHHILETACNEISSKAVSHIKEASDKINDVYLLVEELSGKAYEDCVFIKDGVYHIKKNEFIKLHPTLRGYVIMEVLSKVAGSRKDIETVHVRQVEELFDKQCSRRVSLPYEMEAIREYDGVGIHIKNNEDKNTSGKYGDIVITENGFAESTFDDEIKQRLLKGEEVTLPLDKSNQKSLVFTLIQGEKAQIISKNIPQKTYTKWLDYDRIADSIVVRNRKAGDFLTMNTMNQRKTLKAYFIDKKVPREKRDNICLVTDGSHVLWIVGERISSFYKVNDTTKRIIEIRYKENHT